MRRLSAVLLIATLLTAGCVGAEDVPADEAGDGGVAGSSGAGGDGAPMPADGGMNASAADLGHQPHLHDYWMGRERVTLFEGTVDPNSTGDAFAATTFTALFAQEARVGGVPFLLPEGSIVFEGTGSLELIATPADALTTSLAVSYKHASTPEFSQPVPLPAAEAVALPVTPEMSDMPHSTTSRWGFFFQPEAPGAMLGPFHLKIEVVKMHDIGLFPGHPELFEGENTKVVFQGAHRTEKASYATKVPTLATSGDFGEPEFAPTGVVPMETTLLRIEVRVTGTEATPPMQVTQIRAFFRGADSNFLQPAGSAMLDGEGPYVFDVPVEMAMTDSPYATKSQWRFMIEPATSTGTGVDPTCGGCVDSALEFEATITAFRQAPEDAA